MKKNTMMLLLSVALPAALSVALCVATGCGTTQVGGAPTPTPETSIAGSWRVLSDDVLIDLTGEAGYMRFTATGDNSGTADLFASDATGVLGCAQMLYAGLSENTLAVAFPSSLNDGEVEGGTRVLMTERVDDRLILRDEWGAQIVLQPVDDVPQSAQCRTPELTTRVTTNVQTGFRSGLVFDGTKLWTNGDGLPGAVTLDPTTGALGAESVPLDGDAYWIHAIEGGAFWGFCGCGDNRRVALADNQFTPIDTIDTHADFDSRIHVDAIAKQGDTLLLAGRAADGGKLLRVNAQAEPDVLLEVLPLDPGRKSALMMYDGDLWMITTSLGQVLVRFDLETSQAIETYQLPSEMYWHGLAYDGQSLLMLGNTDETSDLVEITNF